jgi:Cu/Zn superoxide dismutase
MRNSRFVVALVAVACATALPAVAAAHKGPLHGHPGKGKHGNSTVVRLAPAVGQTAKGVAVLTQHANALSVELRVRGLTPGLFYASHLHSGVCASPVGALQLTFPDLYADENGVAKLVTTLPTTPGANFAAGSFYVDVHSGPSPGAGSPISCGDVTVKAQKSAAMTWLKGANGVHGRAEVFQKGNDVTVWISVSGLAAGPHAVHIHSGSCGEGGTPAVSLGDVTAGPDGKVSMKVTSMSSIPVAGPGYSLDVHLGPSATATPADMVACGNLYGARKHGHFHK